MGEANFYYFTCLKRQLVDLVGRQHRRRDNVLKLVKLLI